MPDARRGGRVAPRALPAASLIEEAQRFFGLAAPMIISRAGVAAMGIIDGAMLARYSSHELASIGMADALMGRFLDIAMTFVTAGLALAAQAHTSGSANAARDVGRVWRMALVLAVIVGLIGVLFGLTGGPLLAALGQHFTLVRSSGQVILVLSLGVMPALLALASAGLLEALGKPVGVTIAVVLANVLNVALNMPLIFGWGDIPALGALGAALSTTIVRTLLAAALIALVWYLPERERYRYGVRRPFRSYLWDQGRAQRARGWSSAANVAVLAVLSLGLPVMAGWISTGDVARITALGLALSPMMIIAWGLGDAAGLRIAALHGARERGAVDTDALRVTGRRLAVLLGVVAVGTALPYQFVPAAMVGWATHDPELLAGVLPLLPLGLLAMGANALATVYTNMLRSLGELRQPFIAHASTSALLLPLAWLLAFGQGWGLPGLLTASAALAVVRAGALAWLFDRSARPLQAGAAPHLNEVLV